ncbi:hypothetical protein TNCV_1109801 [Trichonephila clavipes]|nr:hypothetical protein TNCV_1109801 [Trichonephila clavipes]
MIESYLALSLPGDVSQFIANELTIVVVIGPILWSKHGAECALRPKITLRIPLLRRLKAWALRVEGSRFVLDSE